MCVCVCVCARARVHARTRAWHGEEFRVFLDFFLFPSGVGVGCGLRMDGAGRPGQVTPLDFDVLAPFPCACYEWRLTVTGICFLGPWGSLARVATFHHWLFAFLPHAYFFVLKGKDPIESIPSTIPFYLLCQLSGLWAQEGPVFLNFLEERTQDEVILTPSWAFPHNAIWFPRFFSPAFMGKINNHLAK